MIRLVSEMRYRAERDARCMMLPLHRSGRGSAASGLPVPALPVLCRCEIPAHRRVRS